MVRLALAALVLTSGIGGAQAAEVSDELSRLSRAYAESGEAAARERLAAYVARATAAEKPLARLGLGLTDHFEERHIEAAAELAGAAEGSPVADYAAYYAGRALAHAERFDEAVKALADYRRRFPDSRLTPYAAQLRVESLLRIGRYEAARAATTETGQGLEEPARLYLLGRSLELLVRPLDAVSAYRRAYYFHPMSEQAGQAEERLNALRKTLGAQYPDAPADWRVARADRLYDRRQWNDASAEYGRALDAGLSGEDHERARLQRAVADYQRNQTSAAQAQLDAFEPKDPKRAAERLYYLGECARRRGDVAGFEARAIELGRRFPSSPWREEALFSLGNFYLLRNDAAKSGAWYRRTYEAFPGGELAAKAHWKVCWRAQLDRDPRAAALFEEHFRKFPGSDQASAAMYWLGRLLEKDGETAEAAALYVAIEQHFPNYYYAYLGRDRLNDLNAVAPQTGRFEAALRAFPAPRRLTPALREENLRLISRSRALHALGFDGLAERELTTADYRTPDAHLVGLELGRQHTSGARHFNAMRALKRYGFGYLRFGVTDMPDEFWRYLYPLPYGDDLRSRAEPHDLDPYLVAGLIRQESEFNPRAVSRAGAIGLMQVMPRTARETAGRLGMPYATSKLYEPDYSMRLGTFHLRQVIDQFDGVLEYALAAYNAGATRAKEWLSWREYAEPAEFVETIPFTETRGYVQAVLRNRELYRRLYEGERRAAAPSRSELAERR